MLNKISRILILISVCCFASCIPVSGPDSSSHTTESIQPGSISTNGESNNPDPESKPGPKGNAEGIEGRLVLRFTNALSRCEFSQINRSSSFKVDCFASVLDEKNALVSAEASSGVDLEWHVPKQLDGAEITASNCNDSSDALSYHCTLTLDTVTPTSVQFDLNVVEKETKAVKVKSNIVVLPRIAAFQDSLTELVGTHSGDPLFPNEMDFNGDGQITNEDVRILGLFPNVEIATEGISATTMMGKLLNNCRLRSNTYLGLPGYFKACDLDSNTYITTGEVGRLRTELKALLTTQ